jgi:hypothetical protein
MALQPVVNSIYVLHRTTFFTASLGFFVYCPLTQEKHAQKHFSLKLAIHAALLFYQQCRI